MLVLREVLHQAAHRDVVLNLNSWRLGCLLFRQAGSTHWLLSPPSKRDSHHIFPAEAVELVARFFSVVFYLKPIGDVSFSFLSPPPSSAFLAGRILPIWHTQTVLSWLVLIVFRSFVEGKEKRECKFLSWLTAAAEGEFWGVFLSPLEGSDVGVCPAVRAERRR